VLVDDRREHQVEVNLRKQTLEIPEEVAGLKIPASIEPVGTA
jgi:hypothetical protein